mgnify:FL=1
MAWCDAEQGGLQKLAQLLQSNLLVQHVKPGKGHGLPTRPPPATHPPTIPIQVDHFNSTQLHTHRFDSSSVSDPRSRQCEHPQYVDHRQHSLRIANLSVVRTRTPTPCTTSTTGTATPCTQSTPRA